MYAIMHMREINPELGLISLYPHPGTDKQWKHAYAKITTLLIANNP